MKTTFYPFFEQIKQYEIMGNDYLEFLADLYEQEDLFWKEYFEDLEADYWIDYIKENDPYFDSN